jgi:hypothetical protein
VLGGFWSRSDAKRIQILALRNADLEAGNRRLENGSAALGSTGTDMNVPPTSIVTKSVSC